MEDTMALIPQSRDTLSHRMGEGLEFGESQAGSLRSRITP